MFDLSGDYRYVVVSRGFSRSLCECSLHNAILTFCLDIKDTIGIIYDIYNLQNMSFDFEKKSFDDIICFGKTERRTIDFYHGYAVVNSGCCGKYINILKYSGKIKTYLDSLECEKINDTMFNITNFVSSKLFQNVEQYYNYPHFNIYVSTAKKFTSYFNVYKNIASTKDKDKKRFIKNIIGRSDDYACEEIIKHLDILINLEQSSWHE